MTRPVSAEYCRTKIRKAIQCVNQVIRTQTITVRVMRDVWKLRDDLGEYPQVVVNLQKVHEINTDTIKKCEDILKTALEGYETKWSSETAVAAVMFDWKRLYNLLEIAKDAEIAVGVTVNKLVQYTSDGLTVKH